MRGNARYYHGFSLMEMTVVLLVLSVITGAGLDVYNKRQSKENADITKQRLDVIEAALTNYKLSNHRFPCPANGTIQETAANFGYAAANLGQCTGGTPAANNSDENIVAGVVPTRALQLTNDYMYDGWGRRITYMIDVRATGANAFINYNASSNDIGVISVKDAQGGTRTSSAVYALISYGANGYGAYLQNGGIRNNESTNTDEINNASFDNQIVARAELVNSTSSYNQFDDIVRFKERWNLTEGNDLSSNNYSYGGPALLVGHKSPGEVKPLLMGYNTSYNIITNSNDIIEYGGSLFAPGNEPSMCPTGISLTQDNLTLAMVHDGAPWISIYKWTASGFKKIAISVMPLPTGNYSRVEWSPDGTYLAVANSDGNADAVLLYKYNRTTNVLTFVDSNAALDKTTDVAWDPYSTYLIFSSNESAKFVLFKVDKALDKLVNLSSGFTNAICTLPTAASVSCTQGLSLPGKTNSVDWSKDGSKIAFAGLGGVTSLVYDFNYGGDQAKDISYLIERKRYTVSTGDGLAVAFSPNGSYLIESFEGTNHWVLYKWNQATETYAKLWRDDDFTPDCWLGRIDDFSFSGDERYVAFGLRGTNTQWVGEIQEQNNRMVCYSKTFADTNVHLWALRFKNWQSDE